MNAVTNFFSTKLAIFLAAAEERRSCASFSTTNTISLDLLIFTIITGLLLSLTYTFVYYLQRLLDIDTDTANNEESRKAIAVIAVLVFAARALWLLATGTTKGEWVFPFTICPYGFAKPVAELAFAVVCWECCMLLTMGILWWQNEASVGTATLVVGIFVVVKLFGWI